MKNLSSDLAYHIVERMGTTGQPPERGARFVNVATENILNVLSAEYLQPLKGARRGNSTFKLVQAPFGGGKTHFLHCMREMAWAEGYITCLVGLSPKECPFDRPLSIYREVALKIELPVTELEEELRQGFDHVLSGFVQTKIADLGKEKFKSWVMEEFSNRPIESRQFGRAVRAFLIAAADNDVEAVDILGDYLRGDEVPRENLAAYRITERIDDKNAFRWLRSLAQCIAAFDFPGIVLMFDEMDRNMSLSAGRRRAIGDNLRQMIDYCGQSALPGVIWCYAVPPEFMDTVVPEYPALAQRLKGVGNFGASSPLQPVINLDRLDMKASEIYKEIGFRLLDVYQVAHDTDLDAEVQRENIELLAKELGEVTFESGTRRQFVKAVISVIDAQHREGQKVLTQVEIERAANGAAPVQDIEIPGELEL